MTLLNFIDSMERVHALRSYKAIVCILLLPCSLSLGAESSDSERPIAFSADGELLAQVDLQDPSEIRVWNLNTRSMIQSLSIGHRDSIVAVAVSSDSKVIAASDMAGRVALWNLAAGGERTHLGDRGKTPIDRLFVSRTGKLICGEQPASKTVFIWNGDDGTLLGSFSLEGGQLKYCDFSETEDGVVVIATHAIWRWNRSSPSEPEQVASDLDIRSVMPSADCRLLALTQPESMTLVSVSPFVLAEPLEYALNATPAFSPDGKNLLVFRFDDERPGVDYWDLSDGIESATFVRSIVTGEKRESPVIATSAVQSAFSSEDGSAIALASPDLKVVEKLGLGMKRPDNEAALVGLSFTPDGAQLASVYADGLIRLWNVKEKRLISESRAGGPIAAARIVGGGETLALVASSGEIELRDYSEHEAAAPVELAYDFTSTNGHRGNVIGMDFSPDGSELAILSSNEVVLLDAATGRKRGSIPRGGIAIGYSEDGESLLLIASHSTYRYRTGPGILEEIKEISLGGIGMEYREEQGRWVVGALIPGKPAAKSDKIRPGDEIVAIAERGNDDFTYTRGKTETGMQSLFYGPLGAPIRLRLRGVNGEADVDLVRKSFDSGTVEPTSEYGKPVRRKVSSIVLEQICLRSPETGSVVAMVRPQSVYRQGHTAESHNGKLFAVLARTVEGNGFGLEIHDTLTGEIKTAWPIDVTSFVKLNFTADDSQLIVTTRHTAEMLDFRRRRVVASIPIQEKAPASKRSDNSDFIDPGSSVAQAASDIIDFTPNPYKDDTVDSAVSKQGVIAVGSRQGVVSLIDLSDGRLLSRQPHDTREVSHMTFSEDGGRLAYFIDGTIYVAHIDPRTK